MKRRLKMMNHYTNCQHPTSVFESFINDFVEGHFQSLTRYFMDIFIEKRKPIMLVGNAGSGKTVLINNKLNSLNGDQYVIANAPFNFYTTSEMLQRVLEKPLEKKAGRNYGPPGTKKLIYFIDDMNMPEVTS